MTTTTAAAAAATTTTTTASTSKTATTCRACGGEKLEPVLDLGSTPLANALLKEEDLAKGEASFPLHLVFCPACALVQITEEVPPEAMFSEYLYFSSFSDTMLKHAEDTANRLIKDEKLGPKSLVVEVASNDGYLLQFYQKAGVPVIGVDPAANVAKVAEEKGIRTLVRFFGKDLAVEMKKKGERANLIHANNVLAHVPDLNGVVEGFATLLADDGVVVIEVPYVRELVDKCEFDTIYHEHLCYFSLTSLVSLMKKHDLVVHDVEQLSIHGGSLRVFASKGRKPTKKVTALLADEKKSGLNELAYYTDFAERVNALKKELVEKLEDLREQGARIAAYGAAAKGATLVNFFGLNKRHIDFVVDRSTHKQGRYMPGARIPIKAPNALLEKQPDFCLLLAWNFADEILEQQSAFREGGGKFIIPIPNVRIE